MKSMIMLGLGLLALVSGATELDFAKRRVKLPANAFTVALTVTPEMQERTRVQAWGYVCGLGTGYWDGFRLRMRPSRHGCIPSLEIGKPRGQGSFTVVANDAVIPAGVARHLAATWDGATARLFVGGRCVAEKPYTGNYVQDGPLPFAIGRAAYGLTYYPFRPEGTRLWDEALSAEEIARLAETVETTSDEAVAAFMRKPLREVCAAVAAEAVEPRFRALAGQIVFAAFERNLVTDAPVKVLDAFAARLGTNDWHRVLDFRLRRARALADEGRGTESREAYAAIWAEAKREAKPYAAWAGLAYAGALDRAGEATRAQQVRAEAKGFARAYLKGECGGEATQEAPVVETVVAPGREFFVSPAGDDAADGSEGHPFATLTRAQRAVREVRAKGAWPKGGVTVWLREGVYPMAETLALTAEDSGEAGAPMAWKAWREERPVLEGGWRVPRLDLSYADVARLWPKVAARLPAEARSHVVACDVKAAGYAHLEPRPEYGFYRGEVGSGRAITDLYCEGRPMELAREPNAGWLQTGEVLDASTNRVFRSDAGDLRKWMREPDLMLTGYWKWHWADQTLFVKPENIDAEAGTIALGQQSFVIRKKRPYFFVNALCALDAPGEWYLDRATGLLLVWPSQAGDAAGRSEYTLSDFNEPFISLDGVRHVTIEGLVLQHGRGMAVKGQRCSDVVFAGNVVRRFGADGVWFLASKDMTIRGNVLRDFGHGALRVSGGDRRTLTPSGISVVDNDISWVERWKRTYAPGLHGDGCGTEVARNHFHDMRSSAMRLEGNDWWVASNVVERVVTESDDQGGIDIYANPTYAGNVICFNVWRDIGCGGENAPCGQAGVRFDDAVSSMYVYGNYFRNCSHGHFGAVQMNGGRNNMVDNNVFEDCAIGVSIGVWPEKRWEGYFKQARVKQWRAALVEVTNSVYVAKYPGILELPQMPMVNWLTRNVVVGTGSLSNYPAPTVTFGNRVFDRRPTMEELAREPGFRPLPDERELGPRNTPDLIRARRNAGR